MSDETYTGEPSKDFLAAVWLTHEVDRLRAENAALREIVEAVALVNFGHVYAEFCPFCEKVFYEGEPDRHTEDCPITKARALLRA